MSSLTLEAPVIEKQSPTWLVGWEVEPTMNLIVNYEIPIDEDEAESYSEDGKYVTEEEYWAKYYEHPWFNYEWNNGYLEELSMSNHLEYTVYRWFMKILDQYLEICRIAEIIGLETGFRLALHNKISVRKPDLGIVLNNNPMLLQNMNRSYNGIFDICIESISASNKKSIQRDTVIKRSEYEAIGVKEYYILDERGKETAFLSNVGGIFVPLPEVNGVISSNVLPGFQFRVADLYRQPLLIELAKDKVYQGFIMTEYQQERQRAEQERQHAEQERQHAEQERQHAEQERQRAEQAYLRAEQERQRAEQEQQRAEQAYLRLEQERQRAEQAYLRAERLAAKLLALGVTIEE